MVAPTGERRRGSSAASHRLWRIPQPPRVRRGRGRSSRCSCGTSRGASSAPSQTPRPCPAASPLDPGAGESVRRSPSRVGGFSRWFSLGSGGPADLPRWMAWGSFLRCGASERGGAAWGSHLLLHRERRRVLSSLLTGRRACAGDGLYARVCRASLARSPGACSPRSHAAGV